MPDSWWPHGLQQQSSLSFTVSWSLLTHVHGVGAATPATESVSSHSKRLHMSYSDSDSVSISLTHTCLQPTPFSSSLVSKTLTLFVLLLSIFLFQFNFSPNLVKWKSQFGARKTLCVCICVCVFVCVCVCSVMSNSLWPHGLTVAHQAPLSMGFPRQEWWKERAWKSLSCVWLFATSWTIQCMAFSKPENWSW